MATPTRSLALAGPAISFQIVNIQPDTQGSPQVVSPTLEKLEGYFISDVAVWLQLWDLATDPTANLAATPANGCRRVLYLGALQPNGFLWQYMDCPLLIPYLVNGLRACLSTSPTNYVAPNGTTEKLDNLYVELEDWELESVGLSQVGDLTTAVSTLQVWSEAGGGSPQNRLVKVDIHPIAGPIYLQLFATDVVNVGDIPIYQYPQPVNGASITVFFGKDGRPVFSHGANGTKTGSVLNDDNTAHNGCTLAASATSYAYDGTKTMNCRAWYNTHS